MPPVYISRVPAPGRDLVCAAVYIRAPGERAQRAVYFRRRGINMNGGLHSRAAPLNRACRPRSFFKPMRETVCRNYHAFARKISRRGEADRGSCS